MGKLFGPVMVMWFVTLAVLGIPHIAAHPDVIMNPLHAMGFPTIGCFPCTTPVRPDEPERAGRWRHLAGVEYCGINPTDRAASGEPTLEIDDRYAAALGIG